MLSPSGSEPDSVTARECPRPLLEIGIGGARWDRLSNHSTDPINRAVVPLVLSQMKTVHSPNAGLPLKLSNEPSGLGLLCDRKGAATLSLLLLLRGWLNYHQPRHHSCIGIGAVSDNVVGTNQLGFQCDLICPRRAWVIFKPRFTSVTRMSSSIVKVRVTPFPREQPLSGMVDVTVQVKLSVVELPL